MSAIRKIVTDSMVFSKGKNRNVILYVHKSGLVEIRIKGLRQHFQTTAGKLYWKAEQGAL